MLKSLEKSVVECGFIADDLQKKDPTLNRIDAITKALKIQKGGD